MIVCKGAPFVTGVFITSRLNTHFLSTPPHPGQRCLLLVVATCTISYFTICSCFHFLLVMLYYLFLLYATISSMCCYLHYLWLLFVLFVTFYLPHLRQPCLLLLVFLPHLGLGSSLWLEGEPDISLLFHLHS